MRIVSFVGLIVAAVALVSASGAATGAKPVGATIDLSTKAKVHQYLRSIHVNPKGVVIQRGLRNYAGPNCPGKGWRCASTKRTVVQIAKWGGQNRSVCKSSKCVVVQISGTSRGVYASGRQLASTAAPNKGGSSGVCLKNGSGSPTGSGQSCTIIQSGSGPNTAVVWENSQKVAGLTTSLSFTAVITQTATGASQGNTACVLQNINLDGSTTGLKGKPVTATLEASQSVSITQDSASGPNKAEKAAVLSGTTAACDTNSNALGQNQTLTSTVNATASITQNQNAASNGADVVMDIEQNQNTPNASGANTANFTQTMNQQAVANTTNGKTVTQTQGANVPDPPFSGGVGTVNQHSSSPSTAIATQIETQCEDGVNTSLTPAQSSCDTNDPDAPTGITLTQTQYGPEGVFTPPKHSTGRVPFFHKGYGASTQTGNSGGGSSFTLHQVSTQDTDNGPHTTQSNIIQGDCITDGSCEAAQTATLNGQNTVDGYTAGTITALIIHCPNGHSSCTATPPPAPEITGGPDATSESTSATFTWTDDATAGVTFECSTDGGTTFNSCSSGDTFSNLPLGSNTFEVRAVDAGNNRSDADSFTWTIVPYLTFEATSDGASAGWSGTPGASPITLIVGSNPGTYGQFTLHNFEGIAIGDLPAEPTFTTDTFSGGAPRYEIDLANGDYLFGYPSNAPYGRSWDLNCGHVPCTPMAQVPWGDVQTAESTAKITDVLVEADWPPGVNATYSISDFTFDTYSLSFFGNHWH
jgi:hypothetical protein